MDRATAVRIISLRVEENNPRRRSGRLGLGLDDGRASQQGEHPKVMRQHGPSYGQLAMGKTLAAQAPAQKDILDNGDAPFGLGPPPL